MGVRGASGGWRPRVGGSFEDAEFGRRLEAFGQRLVGDGAKRGREISGGNWWVVGATDIFE